MIGRREKVSSGDRRVDRERGIVLDPTHEGRDRIAPDECIGNRRAHARVEAEACERTVDAARDLVREASRGVHRDRDRDPVGPLHQLRRPVVDREVEQADLVAAVAQCGGRRGNAERLMA